MTSDKLTTVTVGITHSPYNRMMIRDMSLVGLAVATTLGIIVLIGVGRPIPGELWGMASAMIGAIVGSMGKYNGRDSTVKTSE